MPTFAFEVEYSKSGRAACKHCKDKIDKDVLRFGIKSVLELAAGGEEEDAGARQNAHAMEAVKWHHFGCLARAKGPRWFRMHVPEQNDAVSGFGALRSDDQVASVGRGSCSPLS